jgi:hypothetical protein
LRKPIEIVLLLLTTAACKCGGSTPPPSDFDGNFVSGDAFPIAADRPLADAIAHDAALDAELDASEDAASDAADAADAELPDAGMDATPDSACSALPTASVNAMEAVAQSAQLAGMIVDVSGTATISAQSCTTQACADGGACCNTCSATIAIDGLVRLTGSECIAFSPGCSGNECARVCRPPLIGIGQHFRGRLDRRDGGVLLELFDVLQ